MTGQSANHVSHALTVQRRLIEHYIPQIISVTYDGEPVAPPQPIQWYPDQLAWSMTTPKNVIRKFPPFASFQKFLVSENSVGNITRQEIVSMIPPLLMDVRPGMTVLDLCAAPGSKSAQLIELVHGGEEARMRRIIDDIAKERGREASPEGMEVTVEKEQADNEEDSSDDGRPTGLLIANDVDYRRAQLLIHQCKRLNSPNLIVTNHDAILFPSIRIPTPAGQPAKYLKFDRILADVPCSGDGTARKNLNIWKDWIPGNGLGLHVTQVRILIRALQMLKVGGRVVYSTCSMNPVENEAVVANAIDRCGGSAKVELLDRTELLPGLVRKKGLTTWNIMDKSGRTWSSWADVVAKREADGESGLAKLAESMFPPHASENVLLERCLRVYPHLQDTGGFFIAVLEKKSEIKARPEGQARPTTKQPLAQQKNSVDVTAPPIASITAIANEIEAQTAQEVAGLGYLQSIDAVNPPSQKVHDDGTDQVNAPAAARQNRANTDDVPVSPRKRALDDEADADAATKRMKIRNNEDGPAEEGDEDRLVHYPPPPGADLALTAHHHDSDAVTALSTPAASAPQAQPSHSQRRGNNYQQTHEEPFKFLSPEQDDLREIYAFYGLSPRFPRDRFMVRNATGVPAKAVYYTSALARDILVANEGAGLKFVHCGIKMFVKQDVQGVADACRWRIQSEGIGLVEAWVDESRVVRCHSRETLRTLLREMFPRVSGVAWKDLGEVGERTRDVGVGCCVLRVEPRLKSEAVVNEDGAAVERENGDDFTERLIIPLWRGIASLNLMLPKEERKAMLLRLYNDDSPLIDHSQERAAERRRAGREADANKDADAGEAVVKAETKSDVVEGEESRILHNSSSEEDDDAVMNGEQNGA